MASWGEVAALEPEFAERVRVLFDAHRHKVLATLRKDGSPRISGIEAEFSHGQVTMGVMVGSLKLGDLRRDRRLALHSASEDPPEDNASEWIGDATISGVAIEIPNPEPPGEPSNRHEGGHVFRIDIREVTLVRVGRPADHLVIESWLGSRGFRRIERR